ncbi:hypothetical protein [Vibrio phage D4]|nr:hypothetical protein vBVcaS_HC036 [Vibrio phage vB_VcaS_HC]UHD87328.1 hypothetical protein [Vibrio phage D4]WKV32827.1 hypothetical protein R21Y_66 [Vibrio phage vB_VhaS_R21Y]
MTVLRLGTIELDPNMQVPLLSQSANIAMTTRPTLAGGVVAFQKQIRRGQSLQLIATADQGWVSKTARDQLLEAANTVNNILVLEVGDRSFRVMFDHSEGAAVQLEPFINRLIPLEGDYFTGTINLLIV